MIQNIIFDIGEVLVDFRYRELFASHGYDADMIERLTKATILNPVWKEFDLGNLSVEEVTDSFISSDPEISDDIRLVLQNLHDIVAIRPFSIPWVKELKAQNLKVYFLSNYFHKLESENPEALAFRDYMDGGVFSYQIHKIKPDAEIYLYLLDKFGLKAEECVFFDDRAENVNAANALGIHGIVFQSYEQARAELEALLRS